MEDRDIAREFAALFIGIILIVCIVISLGGFKDAPKVKSSQEQTKTIEAPKVESEEPQF